MKRKTITAPIIAAMVLFAGCTVDEPDDDVLAWRYETHFGTDNGNNPYSHASNNQGGATTDKDEAPYFSISYSTSLGETPEAISVKKGESFTVPDAPYLSDQEDAAYYFDGWYNGNKKLEGSCYPSGDMTLVATWKDQYCTLEYPTEEYLRKNVFIDGDEKIMCTRVPQGYRYNVASDIQIRSTDTRYYADIILYELSDDQSVITDMQGEYDERTGRATLTGNYFGEDTEWVCQFFIDQYGRFFMQIDPDECTFSKNSEGLVGEWTRKDAQGDQWYTIVTEGKYSNYFGFVEYEFVEKESTVSNVLYDGQHLYQDTYYYTLGSKSKSATAKKTIKSNNHNQSEVSK